MGMIQHKFPEVRHEKSWVPDSLWRELDGKLFHATGPEQLKSIIADGEIRILDGRYRKSFCKKMECVSLFDFGPGASNDCNQHNNMLAWLGHEQGACFSFWLEIDRQAACEKVIAADELRKMWEKHLSCKFIPGFEAGHRGPVGLGSIRRVLFIYEHNPRLYEKHDRLDENPVSTPKCIIRRYPGVRA